MIKYSNLYPRQTGHSRSFFVFISYCRTPIHTKELISIGSVGFFFDGAVGGLKDSLRLLLLELEGWLILIDKQSP